MSDRPDRSWNWPPHLRVTVTNGAVHIHPVERGGRTVATEAEVKTSKRREALRAAGGLPLKAKARENGWRKVKRRWVRA